MAGYSSLLLHLPASVPSLMPQMMLEPEVVRAELHSPTVAHLCSSLGLEGCSASHLAIQISRCTK